MSANDKKDAVNKPLQEADYTKAEMDLLREALKRTHAERFFFATRLYKIGQTLSKATITHQRDELIK